MFHIILISEDHVTLKTSNDAENTEINHKFNTYSAVLHYNNIS